MGSSENQTTFLEPQPGLNLEDLEGWDQLPQEVKKELGICWLDSRSTVDILVGEYEEQIRLSPDHLRPGLYEKFYFDHFNHVAYSMMPVSLAGAPDGQINPFYHPFLNQIAEQECNHLKHRYGLHKKPVEPTKEQAAQWRAMDPSGEMDRLMAQLRLKQEEHVRQFRARLQARIFVLLGEARADKAKVEKKALEERRKATLENALSLRPSLLAEWEAVKNTPIGSQLRSRLREIKQRFESFAIEVTLDFHFTVDARSGVCLCEGKHGTKFDGLAAEVGQALGLPAGLRKGADNGWANLWKFSLWCHLKERRSHLLFGEGDMWMVGGTHRERCSPAKESAGLIDRLMEETPCDDRVESPEVKPETEPIREQPAAKRGRPRHSDQLKSDIRIVAKNIERKRIERSMSREQLSVVVGVSEHTVDNHCVGSADQCDSLHKYAAALRCDIDDLIEGVGHPARWKVPTKVPMKVPMKIDH